MPDLLHIRQRFVFDADFSPHWSEVRDEQVWRQYRHRIQRYTLTKDGKLRYQPVARDRIKTWRADRQRRHAERHHRNPRQGATT